MPAREKSEVLGDIGKQAVVVKGKTYTTFMAYLGTDREGKKIRRFAKSERLAREKVAKFFRGLKGFWEGIVFQLDIITFMRIKKGMLFR
jgi:hypothetical protein